MSKAKEVLLFELDEQMHPERVEDVIYWALKYYHENRKKGTWGETIAYSIVRAIEEAEGQRQPSSLKEIQRKYKRLKSKTNREVKQQLWEHTNSKGFEANTIKNIADSYKSEFSEREKQDILVIKHDIFHEAESGGYGITVRDRDLSDKVIKYFTEKGYDVEVIYYNGEYYYDIYWGV